MNTVNRIARLLAYTGLPELEENQLTRTGYLNKADNFVTIDHTPGHSVLDMIDTQLNVDTRTLGALECSCLWHIGKCCSAVRQLGARVTLLEEAVARDRLEQEIERNKEAYAYG